MAGGSQCDSLRPTARQRLRRLCSPLAAFAVCGRLGLAGGFELEVVVHYPEAGSALGSCSLQLHVAASLEGLQEIELRPVPARRQGPNHFAARLLLPDSVLYTRAEVGVLASSERAGSEACQAVCPGLVEHAWAEQAGPFLRTAPLEPESTVELWPAFCKLRFESSRRSFFSTAIGRTVEIEARVPAALVENALPRPSAALPAVMFRFNSEWYWPDNFDKYSTWHDLMVFGQLSFFVVAEIYVEGVTWKSWNHQPIYTTGQEFYFCGQCDPDMQFICDAWESSGYFLYRGGNHSFGSAATFFDELHETALPMVMDGLPPSRDSGKIRVGAWGYCIGGLAAWNALLTRPFLFTLGYFGSPAVDFSCGAPLRAADTFKVPAGSEAFRPKIYIDVGAAEGVLMNRQTLMLFRKLQAAGLVEGRDVFYSRAAFGTHQNGQMWRRSLLGVMVLFGTGSIGRRPRLEGLLAYVPVQSQATIVAQPEDRRMGSQESAYLILLCLHWFRRARLVVLGAPFCAAAWLIGRSSERWRLRAKSSNSGRPPRM